ncbi:2Fe-2S iron-sulfur cluster binding domain-containing protein [Massilia sp. UMI-21]|nr:2Fe-2S iron-sulfur cluster binding domain-containing protein [Massilia sp. UMI-21]
MKKLHKWIGLLIGIQFLLWMSSGVVMSLLDADKVAGRTLRTALPLPAAWPADVLAPEAVLAANGAQVMTLSSAWLLGRPVYMLQNDQRSWLVGATDGRPVAIDAPLALAIARASYAGRAAPAAPRLLTYSLETRAHKDAVWRVDFADADETTVYVSSVSGKVLEHRNSSWRLFDFFWMLHIMDYSERTDFNHPLLVSSAAAGLWMALSGVWLLLTSLRLAEFVPASWRRRRSVKLRGCDGETVRLVDAAEGDTVFRALARAGLALPSTCGGGQSCGLCEVRCLGQAPAPTAADRALLSPRKLAAGYRLACNLPVRGSVDIAVEASAALQTEHTATVTGTQALTPFLREITIRARQPLACRPGCYVQIHVPAYARDAGDIELPEHHRADWRAAGNPARLVNHAPLRRAYSVCVPVEQLDGQLSFLVRFMPGASPGRGSGYMYTLKAGEEVRFSGPFGDFALKTGGREKVFIGGGAGMAPLRAMIHALLAKGSGEPLHFWYGARSLRDAPYVEEMQAFAERHPNFRWRLVLSEQAADGWMHGLVDDAVVDGLLRCHPDLASLEFYVCGPPAMLEATRRTLRHLGVDDAQVAFEDFKV